MIHTDDAVHMIGISRMRIFPVFPVRTEITLSVVVSEDTALDIADVSIDSVLGAWRVVFLPLEALDDQVSLSLKAFLQVVLLAVIWGLVLQKYTFGLSLGLALDFGLALSLAFALSFGNARHDAKVW